PLAPEPDRQGPTSTVEGRGPHPVPVSQAPVRGERVDRRTARVADGPPPSRAVAVAGTWRLPPPSGGGGPRRSRQSWVAPGGVRGRGANSGGGPSAPPPGPYRRGPAGPDPPTS